MRKITLLLTLLVSATAIFANSAYREIYIDQYKDIAISEMHRVGIPASIKLAQAILESNAGKSTLAVAANNHFGIKCGTMWNGKTFYRKDDDRNKRGKLIKSCFRSFKNPVESFLEHSDFLAVQNRKRYGFLFNYGSSDYTNWAYGLKKAGYATDPHYPKRLITIIEEFQLYKYDNPDGLSDIFVANTPRYEARETVNSVPRKKRNHPNVFEDGSAGEISMDAFKTRVVVNETNKVKFTYATQGDNIGTVATRSGISVKKLVGFNDGIDSYNQPLKSGDKIFLAKKKTKFKGKKKFHYVKAEDNMIGLSQQYGIQVNALYTLNAMPIGSEPAIGEKIRLKGKLRKGTSIKTRMLRVDHPEVILTSHQTETPNPETKDNNTLITATSDQSTFGESISTEEQTQTTINKVEETPPVKVSELEPQQVPVEILWESNSDASSQRELHHVVSKGDTLWNISKRFGIDVPTIKQLNSLSSNTIHIGQKLRIQ